MFKKKAFSDKVLAKFENWLKEHGAEILPTTNEWEACRFRGGSIGVLYWTGKTNGEYGAEAWNCFQNKKPWKAVPEKQRAGALRGKHQKRIALMDRDGDLCFYCSKPLRDDATIEHLVPQSAGGTHALSNLVLAHYACNCEAKNLPLNEKVELAIKKRCKVADLYKEKNEDKDTPPW